MTQTYTTSPLVDSRVAAGAAIRIVSALAAVVILGTMPGCSKQHSTLHGAIPDPVKVKALLQNGADPNAMDRNGDTPLHLLARLKVEDWVESLDRRQRLKGANTHVRPRSEIAANVHRDIEETARLLVAAGARVDARYRGQGFTPLDVAAQEGNPEVAAVLIANGADAIAGGGAGWTPLQIASNAGHAKVIEILLAHGADPHIVDRLGMPARWPGGKPVASAPAVTGSRTVPHQNAKGEEGKRGQD